MYLDGIEYILIISPVMIVRLPSLFTEANK
jgi:hypothetical protein